MEDSAEQIAKTREIVEGDRKWLKENTETFATTPVADPPPIMRRLSSIPGARFLDDINAASGASRLLLADDLFTRQVAAQLGTPSTWLQPVLLVARERGILTSRDYAKALTNLSEIGQQSISIDVAALLAARMLDQDNGETRVGKRLRIAARALGGSACDPASHCSVVVDFIKAVFPNDPSAVDDYAAISHVLLAVLRDRNLDYRDMLDRIDHLLAGNGPARVNLRNWARGHFLGWPRVGP